MVTRNNDDFDFEYDVKGMKRDSIKSRRDKKKIVNGKDVNGVFRNDEGQAMARVCFAISHDLEWPKDDAEARDYYSKVTSGHKNSIEAKYSEDVCGLLGKYVYPTVAMQEIEAIKQKKKLEDSLKEWQGEVKAQETSNGLIRLDFPFFNGCVDIKPGERFAQLGHVYVELVKSGQYIFRNFDPRKTKEDN